MIKLRFVAILLLGLAVMLVSCGQGGGEKMDRKGRAKGGNGKTYELVVAQIDSLYVETSWARAKVLYAEAKEGIEFIKSPSQRRNLLGAADNSFCHSMDTIMYIILSGECKPHHKELREIHENREGATFSEVVSTGLHNQVEEKYKSHEQMLNKTLPSLKSSGQSPTSFKSEYNEKKEKEAVQKATNYLAEHPSCSEIRDGLTKVKEGKLFKGWRKAYCDKLVDLYLQKPDWNQRDENILKGNLSFYTDVYPSDTTEWYGKIRAFKYEHQEENN